MAKIDVSTEEDKQLKKNAMYGGFSVVALPSVEGQPFTWYTDPRSGREMYLPCDAINQRTYLMKGYRLGHLSNCAHATAGESTQPLTEVPLSNALPTNIQDIVNTAVQAALKAAGVEVPEPPVEPKQLAFNFSIPS